jgi:phosphate transport system substrate-binding protein
MRQLKALLMATAAMASMGAGSAHANVLVPLYGGGATFPSKVLRLLMDCYMVQVNGNGNIHTTNPLPFDANCNGGAGYNQPFGIIAGDPEGAGITGVMLYAPVGSGAGKKAFKENSLIPAPATTNKIPFADSRDPSLAFPYPRGPHFIGSDDVVTSSDYNVGASSYVGSGNKAKYGEWIQIPELIGPVTIAYNGKDGAGVALAGAGPGGSLNLSRKTFCGIFSGHINKWNDASLVADNPGLSTATGAIKVVHRSDGSGTNFIFTNALIRQCESPTGPGGVPFGIDDSAAGMFSYEFPWLDASASDAVGRCPAPGPMHIGANAVSWPDAGAVNACGVAVTTAGTFVGASGNGGVLGLMDPAGGAANNGTIGYLTPDFTSLTIGGGVPVANLQNEYDLNLGTGTFITPSAASATIAMTSLIPTFADDAARANPLAWSSQLAQPNPTVKGAYPISGFTMFGFSQCYASANDLTALFGYIKFHYNVSHPGIPTAILAGQGFAPVPGDINLAGTWLGELAKLVTVSAKMQTGPVVGTCSVGR